MWWWETPVVFLDGFRLLAWKVLGGMFRGCFGRYSFALEVLMCGFVFQFSRSGISRWLFPVSASLWAWGVGGTKFSGDLLRDRMS